MKISLSRMLASGSQKKIEPILFEWFTLIGMFIFAGWLLGIRGVWSLFVSQRKQVAEWRCRAVGCCSQRCKLRRQPYSILYVRSMHVKCRNIVHCDQIRKCNKRTHAN